MKLRCSRFGAIGSLCLLSVVTTNFFLPLALMPCYFIMRRTHSYPTRMPCATSYLHILGQQRFIAQSHVGTRLRGLVSTFATHVLEETAGADAQQVTGKRYRPPLFVIGNPGVLHFDTRAKYAVAFPRMSRSILSRAFSARSLASSICSGLTGLSPAPLS